MTSTIPTDLIATYAARVTATAPPLSDEQRNRIVAVFAGVPATHN